MLANYAEDCAFVWFCYADILCEERVAFYLRRLELFSLKTAHTDLFDDRFVTLE